MSASELPLPFGGDPLATYARDLTEAALRGELGTEFEADRADTATTST